MKSLKRIICGTIALAHLNAIAAPAKPTAVVDAEQVSCAKAFAKVDSSQLPVKVGERQATEIFWLVKLRESLVGSYDGGDENQQLLFVLDEIQSYDQRALLTLLAALIDLEVISPSSFDNKKLWKLHRLAALYFYEKSPGEHESEQYLKGMLNIFDFKESELGALIQGLGALKTLANNVHSQSHFFDRLESFFDIALNFQKPTSLVFHRATLSSLIGMILTLVSSQSIFHYSPSTEQLVLAGLAYLFITYPVFAGHHRLVLNNEKNKFNKTREILFAGLAKDLNDPRLMRDSKIRSNIMSELSPKDAETGTNSILALNEMDALDTLIERMLAQPEKSLDKVIGDDLEDAIEVSLQRLGLQIEQGKLLTEEYKIFEGKNEGTVWCNPKLRCARFNSILTQEIDNSIGDSRVRHIKEAQALIQSLRVRLKDVSEDIVAEVVVAQKLLAKLEGSISNLRLQIASKPLTKDQITATEKMIDRLEGPLAILSEKIRLAELQGEPLDKLERNLNVFNTEVKAREHL